MLPSGTHLAVPSSGRGLFEWLRGADSIAAYRLGGCIKACCFDALTSGVDRRHCRFAGQVLAGRDLSRSDLCGVDLSNTDLSRAVLVGVDLRRADLRWAKLLNADLSFSLLTGADLQSAKFVNSRLDGTRFDGARNLPPMLR